MTHVLNQRRVSVRGISEGKYGTFSHRRVRLFKHDLRVWQCQARAHFILIRIVVYLFRCPIVLRSRCRHRVRVLVRHEGDEEALGGLSALLQLLDLSQFYLSIKDGLVSLAFQILNLLAERLALRLRLHFLLHQLVQIFVLLIDLVQVLVPQAELLDLLSHFLLDWVVVDLQLHDGLVVLQGFHDQLTTFVLDQVVTDAQTGQRRERASDHVQEL